MKSAELFVKCLENEGVKQIYGIPGEENIDVMDVLLDSPIDFITTHHEQGAAFMADMHGRLTGRAGVCLSTLGPGATNMITGVADADMDLAPLVAFAGQGSTTRLHKESHQILDLVNLFEPVTKYSTQIREPEIIPEVVRKAFKVAETEKPGACFVDFPENIADSEAGRMEALKVQKPVPPVAPESTINKAAKIISEARFPIIMAGNGVIRGNASKALCEFAEKLNLPVATTFMAKGAIPFSHELSMGTVGLQARDYISFSFSRADVIVCIGYDMVEYHPHLWNPDKEGKIIHINPQPAEVDEHYIVEVGVVGDINHSLDAIGEKAIPHQEVRTVNLRNAIVENMQRHADDTDFPLKPQKILWDLRMALNPGDIVISDVGAHKMWLARMYRAEAPNTCIISNGFASMGIALPGAIAARFVYPEKNIVAVTGDAGFMMNSQEIETALRHDLAMVVLIWNDSKYGLIEWHQLQKFKRASYIDFRNPDFIQYAKSFGARAYRVENSGDLLPILKQAIEDNTVVIIDCPVDYSENMKLTESLGKLVCPT